MEQKIRMYPIGQLRKQLSVMEKKKMSPKRIVNMLKLLTGCDVLSMLAGPGLYPAENFYQMAKMFGYRYTSEMVLDVIMSELFYVAFDGESNQNVRWFASPVFMLEKDLDSAKKYEELGTLFSANATTKKNTQISGHIQTTSSINTLVDINIIPPGRTATPLKGAAREEGKSGNEASGNEVSGQGSVTPLGLSRAQRGEIVDAFIRAMRTVEEAPTFDSLREKLIAQGETEENAKGIIGYLMTHTVRNHFMEQDRFFRASFEARKAWLVNVLYGNGADRRLTSAKKYYRAEMMRRTQTDAQERLKLIRGNRPVSPHEWMTEGKRYYQDPYEGVVAIPNDAPPRPGENAIWSVYMLKWMER